MGLDKTLISIFTGVTAFFACVEGFSYVSNKKEDKENIYIDADNKILVIKCDCKNIPCESFEVFTRKGKNKIKLHIKGAAVVGKSKIIKACNEEYHLKGITENELKTIETFIENNEFYIQIKLDTLDKDIKVKHIK